MSGTVLSSYDDLDWHAVPRKRTPATRENIVLSIGDKAVELDLSEEHYKELRDVLQPYMAASRRGFPVRYATHPRHPAWSWLSPDDRCAIRAFADASDDPRVFYRKTAKGSYTYSPELRRLYQEYLDRYESEAAQEAA